MSASDDPALREALVIAARMNAWQNFGECRAFDELTEDHRIYSPSEVDAIARAALAHPRAEVVLSDAEDARRYRWLRDEGSLTWIPFQNQWRMRADGCDAAIDAAILAAGKP